MRKGQIILSTGNPDKVVEIKNIFRDLEIDIKTKKDLGLGDFEIKETGDTLEENAIIKAKALAEKVDGIVIADDTGLFVDYLNGAPGVHSANYGGGDHDYKGNNERLLKELDGVPLDKRQAYFETVIAIVLEDKSIRTVSGRCNGIISLKPNGNMGFGYDPLFIPEGYDKSFGELGLDLKNKISHRSRALEKLKLEINNILEDDANEDIYNKWYPWQY